MNTPSPGGQREAAAERSPALSFLTTRTDWRMRRSTSAPRRWTGSRALSSLPVEAGRRADLRVGRAVDILIPDDRGRRILNRILSAAGQRLWAGISAPGRIRRVKKTTDLLRSANRTLLGTLQLSFFDKDLWADETGRNRARRKRLRPRQPAVTP